MSQESPAGRPRRRRLRWLRPTFPGAMGLVLLVAAIVVAWQSPTWLTSLTDPEPQAPPAIPPATSAAPSTPAEQAVILITVDGLRPDAFASASGGAFEEFRSHGAQTLNARTAVENTETLPNHTGILTGRRVLGPLGHNVDFNEPAEGDLAAENGEYVPGVFDRAHAAGMATGFYAEKPKLGYLLRSWAEQVEESLIGGADEVEAAVLNRLGKERLTFWHIAGPDVAGHTHGWMSPEYLVAVNLAEERIGRLLDAVGEQPGLAERLVVILTADHGGEGHRHDDVSQPESFTIPFAVWGAGVKRGVDLYTINPQRRDPGTEQPSYGPPAPIRNLDAANLAMTLLGLEPLTAASPLVVN